MFPDVEVQNESAKAINHRKEIIGTFFHPRFPDDASKKSVVRRIMELFIPAALEHALLQFTSMFDQIQVSGIGKEALAAIGLSGQLRTFFTTIFIAVNVGVTAMIARSVGQKNHDRMLVQQCAQHREIRDLGQFPRLCQVELQL